jgi:hypothetical protein
LNVLADFQPKVPENYKNADVNVRKSASQYKAVF